MKLRSLTAWFVSALLVFGIAQAQSSMHRNTPLRPLSKCLDINNINGWHVINDTTMTARNGPRRYVIKTQHKCQHLGKYGPALYFHPGHMMGPRICGDIGETVSSRGQPPCAIQSVKLIDKQQYDRLNKQAERSGNGAEQPSLSPKKR